LRRVEDLGVLALEREDLLVARNGHDARVAHRRSRKDDDQDRQRKAKQCVSALHVCTTA
jgi:hypothetical protein